MVQLNIFGGEKLSWRERFLKFHKENPHVYKTIVRMARQARSRGVKKTGMRMIFSSLDGYRGIFNSSLG